MGADAEQAVKLFFDAFLRTPGLERGSLYTHRRINGFQ
jgi:hypothetical protein